MKIDLDKFWALVKEWSVGRLIVLMLLLALLFCQVALVEALGRETILTLFLLGVLLEVYQLSANKLEPPRVSTGGKPAAGQEGSSPPANNSHFQRSFLVRTFFAVVMILSVVGILVIEGFAVYCLTQ